MQRDEYRGETFVDGAQFDLHRASDGLLSFEEMQARREFDDVTKEMFRLTRHELIESGRPLGVPAVAKERITANGGKMIFMRKHKLESSLNGVVKRNSDSYSTLLSMYQEEKKAA